MKKLLLLMLLFSLFLFSSSIDSKIKAKKRELSSQKVEYDKMDKKLSAMASKIITAKEERDRLDNKIFELEESIQKNKVNYRELQDKQDMVNRKLSELTVEIAQKQEQFISLVAEKFSMALVLEELNQPTSESIMLQETYAIYAQENERQIKILKEDIRTLKIKEEYFQNKKENIQRVLRTYQEEREEYKSKKYKKVLLLKALARDKAIYRKRFDKIRSTQRALQHKLSTLKILKRDKAREKRESRRLAEAQRKEELQAQRERETITQEEVTSELAVVETLPPPIVYKEEPIQIATHRGKKTISPLAGSRLIKKFGTYIDPIYKFKIFNKSITLKSSHKGAKVKSILKGRVVFAEDSGGMLGRVVIIEHANQLHTIYAKLARLAPGIHVGKEVLRGSVLGKVNKSLMFEVTKNNKHMNPLKLIKL
jgi:septal ring factor EnvC (AmiA/AmiB activator)